MSTAMKTQIETLPPWLGEVDESWASDSQRHPCEMQCPVCRCPNVHTYDGELIDGQDNGKAWSGRGDCFKVAFYCESGHDFSINFGEHKGNMTVFVQVEPLPVASVKDWLKACGTPDPRPPRPAGFGSPSGPSLGSLCDASYRPWAEENRYQPLKWEAFKAEMKAAFVTSTVRDGLTRVPCLRFAPADTTAPRAILIRHVLA